MGADQQNNPVPLGRYMFADAPPAPAHLAGLARPFVDRAKLTYRNFRVEIERIGGLVVKAMADGQLGKDDATLIWLDVGDVLSTPLIVRYCDARQYDPVVAWLRARPGFQCMTWLRGYALSAMERLVADGEGARAASLALAHIERAMKSLRLDWKERRRGIPKKLAPDIQAAVRVTQAALIARIPVRNAEMLLEIGEMVPYLALGTGEERAALEALRREVLADEERFPGREIAYGSDMSVVTRFAPSPTGRLHVGNLRTALHNWLLARKAGGRFLLRIDDTDAARSEERFVEAIREDLAWLGLEPDGEERQSARLAIYEQAFERLKAAGRVYPAYETAQELDLKRKVQMGRGLPPIYDRAALALSDGEHAAKQAEGIAPHWRFRLDHGEAIEWLDGVRGPQHFEPAQLSDPVVRRADGSWLYMLPSAVDDVAMGVTDVLRGEDHVSNTALQIQMFTALDAAPPRFAHEALLVGSEGKLSKRLGSLGCDALRESGIEPEAIVALLARLGTSQPVEPIVDRATLVETFDLANFGRAPARFDEAELARLNAAFLHQTPFDKVAGRLPEGMGRGAWEAIRPNLTRLADAADWWRVVTGPVAPPAFDDETRAYLAEAARLLAWTDDPWSALTAALKDTTGRKGKALFLPLRQALTGIDHGPDMHALLPLIGEAEARRRLEAAASA